MKTNYKSKHENACFKTIKIIYCSYNYLFQSLGADAINDLSPKVLMNMINITTPKTRVVYFPYPHQ